MVNFDKTSHLSNIFSHAVRMPAVGCCICRRRPRTRFWKATSPVKRKSLAEISVKISTFRRVATDDLVGSVAFSISIDSPQKIDIHLVTSLQVAISVEQMHTRKAVSSRVDADARSGTSRSSPDSSWKMLISTQHNVSLLLSLLGWVKEVKG